MDNSIKPEGKPRGYIFRAWYINKHTGEKIWAKDYGYRAWRIPIY